MTAMSDDELPSLAVGDHVQDREASDERTMVVVAIPGLTAAEYEIEDGPSLAEYNEEYPADDAAYEVVYPQRTDREIDTERTYAFPRSRLVRVAAVHDEEADDVE